MKAKDTNGCEMNVNGNGCEYTERMLPVMCGFYTTSVLYKKRGAEIFSPSGKEDPFSCVTG